MITPSLKRAVAISDAADNVAAYLRNQISSCHAFLTDGGDPQAVFDALGGRAAVDVQCYGIALAALQQMDARRATLGIAPQSEGLVAPDPEIYHLNEDGTVTYNTPTQQP
ncbi:hypothetical protein JIN84_06010 [Luteolibacter yonseiensis]|uniref:Uncharacterized protein n=1 Tax=Luteolibacter yonseiensis TaxID=1144680 RepID=A0A934R1Q8_9BACT|nr:hypothetical protein [Luteolibacter yonseiensis]MBK1815157.1 hypothetical protein [Luteolibacter yonseiensis]